MTKLHIRLLTCTVFFCAGFLAHAVEFANKSMLSEGNWIKIKVSKDGIYELTDAQLKEFGFSNPAEVKVFGYGGYRQDEHIDRQGIDDLPQVATLRENGKTYFYAKGTTSLKMLINDTDATRYCQPTNNPYSSYGYYFLTDRSDIPALNVTSVSTGNGDIAGLSKRYTDGTDYLIFENEVTNPSYSGQIFLGDNIAVDGKKQYTVQFPAFAGTGKVSIYSNIGIKTATLATAKFTVNGKEMTYLRNTNTKRANISYSSYIYEPFSVGATVNAADIAYNGSAADIRLSYEPGNFHTARIDYAQELLDKAAAYVDAYAMTEDVFTEAYQSKLDDLRSSLIDWYKEGTCLNNKPDAEDKITDVITQLSTETPGNVYATANEREVEAIEAGIKALRESQNLAAEAVEGDEEKMEAVDNLLTEINNLQPALDAYLNSDEYTSLADSLRQPGLLEKEAEVAAIRTELTKFYDTEIGGTTYANLLAAATEAREDYDEVNNMFVECHESVQARYAIRMARAGERVNVVVDKVMAYKDNNDSILYYIPYLKNLEVEVQLSMEKDKFSRRGENSKYVVRVWVKGRLAYNEFIGTREGEYQREVEFFMDPFLNNK